MKQIRISIPRWDIEEMTGYKPFTTFWQDFSIADHFGEKGIRDTYRRAFAEWKSNYKYLTELVMVLNHKCWQHHKPGKGRDENALSILYTELFREADEYACEHLKGEELSYYLETTD